MPGIGVGATIVQTSQEDYLSALLCLGLTVFIGAPLYREHKIIEEYNKEMRIQKDMVRQAYGMINSDN